MKKQKKKHRIRFNEWCIGNYYSDGIIELNPYLEKYSKKLYRWILNHELKHVGKSNFANIEHDLGSFGSLTLLMETLLFMAEHPKSIFQLSPIGYRWDTKEFIPDLSLFCLYGFFGLIIISGLLMYHFK